MKFSFSFIAILFFFLLVNISFNTSIWKDIIQPQPLEIIKLGDGLITEIFIEESYQKIIHFQNPFITDKFFYPFETNIVLNDPATFFAILFIPLRPIFSPHQSMMIIVVLNIFLAEIGMYLLLKKFKIMDIVAVLFSLIFAFTPFISIRIGEHITYSAIYLFPWLFFIVFSFLGTKNTHEKYFYSLTFAVLSAITLLSNFYFFITSILILFFYIVYFLISDIKILINLLRRDIIYFIIALFFFFLLIFPWLLAVFRQVFFEGQTDTPGFGGAMTLSADVLSFITPSDANPFYNSFITKLTEVFPVPFLQKYEDFYKSYGIHFAYPGVIILLIYTVICIKWRKIFLSIRKTIFPHFIISFAFATLLLGPFLKILNKWQFYFEGIPVVIPMPFLLLHYIPGFTTMRDPSRLLPAFVFLACIVSGLTMNYWLKNNKHKKVLITTLFVIFLMDQFYVIRPNLIQTVPAKLFQKIKSDTSDFTVMGIPFTVRDGFEYRGFVHDKLFMYGTTIHKKPVIGGYIARVNQSVFSYYDNLPFIHYIAKITDKGNYNPFTEQPVNKAIDPLTITPEQIIKEIEFLRIKYITLKNDEQYSRSISHILKEIGFVQIERDGNYDLYTRNLHKNLYNNVLIGSKTDYLFVVDGLSERHSKYRFVTKDTVRMFLKPKDGKILNLILDTNNEIVMNIYINKNITESLTVLPNKKNYTVLIKDVIKPNVISEITLKFDKSILKNNTKIKLYSLAFN